MTIVEFLNARLDEREALARAATPGPWKWQDPGPPHKMALLGDNGRLMVVPSRTPDVWPSVYNADFMEANHPGAVLADIAAKRAILAEHAPSGDECRTCCGDPYCEEYWDGETETVAWTRTALPFPCPTVRLLASVYSEHPDYQQEWKP